MKPGRRVKSRRSSQEDRYARLAQTSFTVHSLLDGLKKPKIYQDPKYVNGVGEKLRQDLVEMKHILSGFVDGSLDETVSGVIFSAYKDSFGVSKDLTKEKAAEQMFSVIDQIVYKLRVNRFVSFDVPALAKDSEILEKVSVALTPSPFVNENDVITLTYFLQYAKTYLQNAMK